MNAARMYSRLKRKIGSYGIALPLDDSTTLDQLIVDIIEDTTVPVFSIYFPRYDIVSCHSNEFQINSEETMGEICDLYIMPDHLFNGREVLYVREIEYSNNLNERFNHYPGGAMGGYPVHNGVGSIEQLMMANLEKPIVDEIVNRVTFRYEYPKKLYIYDGIMGCRFKLKLACEHDTSLQSISPTVSESFYKLALLDIESALWDLIRPYIGQGGAYDRTEIKADDWEQAESKREEMLKEWDDLFALDQGGYDFG